MDEKEDNDSLLYMLKQWTDITQHQVFGSVDHVGM